MVGKQPLDHPNLASANIYGEAARHSLTYALPALLLNWVICERKRFDLVRCFCFQHAALSAETVENRMSFLLAHSLAEDSVAIVSILINGITDIA